ncbi:sensitivity to high expression protein she9 [Friedmanniomyces endolithicus]|uniref:Sensitive to high expression protein 9, mitochondrial n=1 Tax=Friedmanniomyces endolithicus TaxID=329885 RepID=A0AAN6QQ72_9PEZI|nr:sensitivity to high expression protein she9 [Friedmanniomyces endolithicus]KAK0789456.1 sensitivity to high expression protein she9 [Friedmanniomyces endolithicus]KAK0796678.1 sensitivity to high expression protein she9 [Friedmanniomyces endolithicus]KAK0804250.1 sensitivity to high expression protein she9 [Friedmanniomyces endolithicus]KAK0840106.1 sensitivity to high expression protein she9 [Friedmanniomyces endolithicus]
MGLRQLPVQGTDATEPNDLRRFNESSQQEAASSLPSHVEKRRWQMSKDMTRFVDGILARASIAGQHINEYTGTDYTGIEVLRKQILAQEQKVKDRHSEADSAKLVHREAYTKQAAAQKEIVSLLERKSSWSPTDLERYMSLVRSEHLNDQTVQVAKDDLAAAERELEGARSLLERFERKQYHEEQIWSDTIRRNSTWLTFGLMGVNIMLLLAQILIFEPYRRRKIVRDMKAALDEKTLHVASPSPAAEVVKQVHEVEPAGTLVEGTKNAAELSNVPEDPVEVLLGNDAKAVPMLLAASDGLVEEAIGDTRHLAQVSDSPNEQIAGLAPKSIAQTYTELFYDLFSERLIQMKQVELTTVALQGTAAGVATMGLLFVLLRPK